MTAAPSRHGHPPTTARPPVTGGLPQTVTPLPVQPVTEVQDHGHDRARDFDQGAGARPARRWRGAAVTGAVLTAIWAMLLGDQPGSWLLGVPAVLGGVVLGATVPGPPPADPAPGRRLSPGGAAVFAAWFARASVLGATDVAWRACQPRPAIAPGFRRYTTALPAGAPRTLFSNCITLLPGTLTADLDGARLTIHMLDREQALEADLGALERRVAAIWSLPQDADTKDRT